MNKIRKVITIITLIVFSVHSYSFSLEAGKSRGEMAKSTLKQIYQKYGTLPGFLYEESENKYFSLSKTANAIGIFDLSNEQDVLSGWPLTRWPHAHLPTEISAMLDNATIQGWKQKVEYTSHIKMAGCLNQSPLRFGDVDADAKNELVLFLNGELIIFSPEQGRTVFATFYDADDWYRQGSLGDENEASDVDGKKYQHHSEMLALNGYEHSAYRSYTKVYIQDFDGDGNSDLVSWRKTFQSNPVGDVDGFRLLSNRYDLYKKDASGEYIPQEDTSETTIQSWLTAKNQTWQSGFPSISECAGQEGQLIPEMHDPLLNDPDVLK